MNETDGCDRCGCAAGHHQYGIGHCFKCRDVIKGLSKGQREYLSPCQAFLRRESESLPGLYIDLNPAWDELKKRIILAQEATSISTTGKDWTAYTAGGRASSRGPNYQSMPMPKSLVEAARNPLAVAYSEILAAKTDYQGSVFAQAMAKRGEEQKAAYMAGRKQPGVTQARAVQDYQDMILNDPVAMAYHTAHESGVLNGLRHEVYVLKRQADEQAQRLSTLQAERKNLVGCVETYKRQAQDCKNMRDFAEKDRLAWRTECEQVKVELKAQIDVRDRYWTELLDARQAAINADAFLVEANKRTGELNLLVDSLRAVNQRQEQQAARRSRAGKAGAFMALLGAFLAAWAVCSTYMSGFQATPDPPVQEYQAQHQTFDVTTDRPGLIVDSRYSGHSGWDFLVDGRPGVITVKVR